MSSSAAVAKQQPKEVAQPDAAGGVIEEKEQSAKASANVSLPIPLCFPMRTVAESNRD